MAKSSSPTLDSVISGEVLFSNQFVPFYQSDTLELKETEVGPVPVHWRVAELETAIQQTQYGISKRGERSGQHPILRMNNLSGGLVNTDDLQYVDLSPDEFQKFRLKSGDVLFNRTNSFELVGKTAVYDLSGDHVFASYLIRIATATETLSPRFLNYYMNMESTQVRLKRLATRGVSQSNINATKLKGFAIPLPPLSEQRAIAHVLRTVQQAKEATEKVIAATCQLKQSLMRHLFTYGPVLFDQADKVEVKETDAGNFPASWEVLTIGEMCEVLNGYAFKSEDYVEDGILNFRVVNIRSDGLIDLLSDVRYLPDSFAQDFRKYLLNFEDILLVMVGATRGKITIISDKALPALMNQNMWRIVSRKEEISQRYIYYYLLRAMPYFEKTYSEEARGFFSKQHFRGFPFCFPADNNELQAIQESLASADRKIHAETSRLRSLDRLFESLLHNLMTGKITVRDAFLQRTGAASIK